ncbi:hypothetical protein M0638_17550 [Roseomonas sp. NAR14]|uniref:Uncharacterized protein n=1 Tax=Roseomonas acroporae TaxID=2937791 RepID=A0A9X1Y8N8_9PROT|nr:hypothetical protein [Roseomonas acroporae]MCK8786184.1 hypothetical protein [Roseomonas acroporae]
MADSLLRSFVDDGLGRFLDRLLAETPLGQDRAVRGQITDGRAQAIRSVEALGQPLDVQYVGTRRYGPSLRTLCYVVRYRRSPLLFSFDFYDGGEGWNVAYYAYSDYAHFANWACAGAPALETD